MTGHDGEPAWSPNPAQTSRQSLWTAAGDPQQNRRTTRAVANVKISLPTGAAFVPDL
jgi:hypothetical protein